MSPRFDLEDGIDPGGRIGLGDRIVILSGGAALLALGALLWARFGGTLNAEALLAGLVACF